MEQRTLKKIEIELVALRKAVEGIQEYLMKDEESLELSDEVIEEIKEARKSKGIPHKDVVKEFLR